MGERELARVKVGVDDEVVGRVDGHALRRYDLNSDLVAPAHLQDPRTPVFDGEHQMVGCDYMDRGRRRWDQHLVGFAF